MEWAFGHEVANTCATLETARGKRPSVDGWTFASYKPGTNRFRGSSPANRSSFHAPRNYDALYICDTGTRRKLGVFASRDWPRGYKVIAETPALSCTYWRQRYGKRNIDEEWEMLKLSHKEDLRKCFRKLRKVAMGNNDQLTMYDQKRLESFIEEYAFRPPQSDRAHIYKLASHINHACMSCANAEHWTESNSPNTIHVKLVRPVKSGEEIFIYYNRSDLKFTCPLCPPNTLLSRLKAFVSRIRRMCRLPALINSRRATNSTTMGRNTSDTTLVSSPPRLPSISTIAEAEEELMPQLTRVAVRSVSAP